MINECACKEPSCFEATRGKIHLRTGRIFLSSLSSPKLAPLRTDLFRREAYGKSINASNPFVMEILLA